METGYYLMQKGSERRYLSLVGIPNPVIPLLKRDGFVVSRISRQEFEEAEEVMRTGTGRAQR